MGGSASVWGVKPKADRVEEGVAFILVRAPTDGNRSCYPWLEGSNIIRPSIPKCDRFIRNFNLYFFPAFLNRSDRLSFNRPDN